MWSFQETIRLGPTDLFHKIRASIGFRVLRSISTRQKEAFRNVPPERYLREYSKQSLPGIHVYSFCGAATQLEQVLSLLSFLRHAGIPESWTIASDGSLTPEMEQTLLALHPAVRIVPWQSFITEKNGAAVAYLTAVNFLGKKFAVVTGLPTDRLAIYIDTDVLFFPGAVHLRDLLLKKPRENYYVEDWARWFPEGFLSPEEIERPPLNAGFLIQGRPVDWTEAFRRLERLMQEHPNPAITLGAVSLLIEQAVVQIGYHGSGAQVLDPRQYVINKADSWTPRDSFDHPDRVMRHYLGYLRPKLWKEARNYYAP